MKIISFISLILYILLANTSWARINKCSIKPKINSFCSSGFDRIHPTQFALGMISIKKKKAKVEKYARKGKIEKYLNKKIAPAIIGPDHMFYIIDRHHTSYSILHAKINSKDKMLYLKIVKDWSHLSFKEFSTEMIQHNFVWLKDENHQLRNFHELPAHINHLGDDPYRSLAWMVRKKDGFKKTGLSFQEFYWGIFYKQQGIKLTDSNEQDLNDYLSYALKLASSPLASHLPGYID